MNRTCIPILVGLALTVSSWAQARDALGNAELAREAERLLSQAASHSVNKRFQQSITAYEKVLAIYASAIEGRPLRRLSVPVERAMAWNLACLGRTSAALDHAVRAARTVIQDDGDAAELPRLQSSVELAAQLETRQRGFAAGDSLRSRFEAELDPRRHLRVLGQLQHERGQAAHEAGQFELARRAYTAAIDLRTAASAKADLAWSYNNRGYLETDTGNFEAAAGDLSRAAALALAGGHADIEACIAPNLRLLVTEAAGKAGAPERTTLLRPMVDATASLAPGTLIHPGATAAALLALDVQSGASDTVLTRDAELLATCRDLDQFPAWKATALMFRSRGAEQEAVSKALLDEAAALAQSAADQRLRAEVEGERVRELWRRGREREALVQAGRFLDLCRRFKLRDLATSFFEEASARARREQRADRLANLASYTESIAQIEELEGRIKSTGGTDVTVHKLSALADETPICRAELMVPEDGGDLVWSFESPVLPLPLRVKYGDHMTWVRVPGIDMLLEGTFLQICGFNSGSGEVRPRNPPAWDPLNPTFPLRPGLALTVQKNGGMRIDGTVRAGPGRPGR